MTEARADRPEPATLNHFTLAAKIARSRAEAPLAQHGRDAVTLVRDPALSVVLVTLEAGGFLPEHHATGPITVLVLEGRIAFLADDRRLEAGPHDLITLEANAPHRVDALEASAVLVTIAAGRTTLNGVR